MVRYLIAFVLLVCSVFAQAQTIATAYTYQQLNTHNYLRYTYENDFFTATDALYTQGINLEYANNRLGNFIVSKALVSPSKYKQHYKIGLQHNAYTPQSIQDPSIRVNDQPYAAALFLQLTNTALHPTRKIKVSSTLSAGIIGYWAGGEWMQKTIHRNLDNVAPQGWKYQIANAPVINYRLQVENNLITLPRFLSLNSTASIDVGSLLNRLSAGVNLSVGVFNNLYHNTDNKKNITVRLFAHPQIHAVAYDATLQGGITGNSVHTLPASQIENIVLENSYGVALQIHRLYLQYFYTNRSKNFSTGVAHAWGGISIGYIL